MMKRHNIISKLISHIGIILSFLIIIIVVYAPVIQIGFLYLDDYGHFKYTANTDSFLKEYSEYIPGGRFGQGFIIYSALKYVKPLESIESTKTIRLVSIIGLALFATVMYAIFKLCRFRADHAFLISTSICMLPSFQVDVSWIEFIPAICSLLFTSLSVLLLFNVIFANEKRTYTSIRLSTALVLYVVALSMYQPSAMMYWAFGVILLFTVNDYNIFKKEWHPFLRYLFFGLISIAVYYLVFVKILPSFMNLEFCGRDRASLITLYDIPRKLGWFLTSAFKNAVNLWNIYPTYKFAIFIGTTTFIGIVCGQLQEIKERRTSLSRHFQKYFIILCLIILSYLPNLIVRESWAGYRTIISLTTTVYLLFCFGIINIVEFFNFLPDFSEKLRKTAITISLTIITIVSAVLAYNNVKDFAMLQSNELKYVKNVIQEYRQSHQLLKIYVRRPISPAGPLEFGRPTTSESWGASSLVQVALHELGVRYQDTQIIHGPSNAPLPEDRNVLVIDMVKFQLNSNKFKQKLD